MKKKILFGVAALAIATVAAFNVNVKTKNDNISLLSLSNIEALAQESGTPAGRCYIVQYFGDYGNKIFCTTDTNEEKIYPCPSSTSYQGFSESAKDRCTK